MIRISVSFNKKTLSMLNRIAEKKGITTATCIRECVETHLYAEMENAPQSTITARGKSLEEIMRHELIMNRETLSLARYLLSRLPEETKGENKKLLEFLGNEAKKFVDEIL